VDVFCLFAAEIAVAIWGEGLWCLDDFDVETGAEGGEVCDGEVVGSGISIGGKLVCELTETECSEDGNNVGIMGEVKVETLVKWESFGTAVQSDVDLRA
jgi:hypothetical protein